jgi:hypothetical protein
MSYVGHRYDLNRNGKPLRVVMVGQESGWPSSGAVVGNGLQVSLSDRYAVIHDDSGLSRSYYASDGRSGRNPHMRGTTSALRVIFGKGLGADHAEEWVTPVNGHSFHLFDGFALVNRLLCSAGPADSSQGRSTRTMRDRCLEHFTATLKILDPTVVVLQGTAVGRWSSDVLVPTRVLGPNLYAADFNGRQVLVCAFSHPAAHGGLRWGDSLSAPYLIDTVVPTLRNALSRL